MKLRNIVNRFLYRRLRDDMVARMRVQGFTFSKINTVLRSLGHEKVVTHYEILPHGIRIYYAGQTGDRVACEYGQHPDMNQYRMESSYLSGKYLKSRKK